MRLDQTIDEQRLERRQIVRDLVATGA